MEQNYTPHIITRIVVFLLMFCFVFSIQFAFLPLGTRALLGVVGFVYLFVRKLPVLWNILLTKKLFVNKYIFSIGLSLLLIAVTATFASFVNGTNERLFMFYPISMGLIFLGAYLVSDVMRRVYHRLDFGLISSYFIGVVIVQLLISLTMFFAPEIKSFVAVIVQFDEMVLSEMLKEGGFRLMGFGVQFFAAGIINCFTLLLIVVRMKYYVKGFKDMFWLTLSFIFVTAIGMMMSRTTMVGAGVALGLLLLGVKINIRHLRLSKFFSVVKSLLVLVMFMIPLWLSLPEDMKNSLEKAGEYGFEMFVNYAEKGEATTASSNQLKTMYDTYPTEPNTWIIGDGWFADPIHEGSYYMRVDVGYLRLLFYVGLIGLIAYFNYQYQMIRYFNHLTYGKYKLFTIAVFVLLLILNLKGFTDFTQLMSIFLFIPRQTFLNGAIHENKH